MLRNALRKLNATYFFQASDTSCLSIRLHHVEIIYFIICAGSCCKNMEYPIICKKKLSQILRNALRCYATLACHYISKSRQERCTV